MDPNSGLLLTRKGSISVTLLRHWLQNVEQRRGQLPPSLRSRDEFNKINTLKKNLKKITECPQVQTRHERQQRAVFFSANGPLAAPVPERNVAPSAAAAAAATKKVANQARNIVSAPSLTKEPLIYFWWGWKRTDLRRPGKVHAQPWNKQGGWSRGMARTAANVRSSRYQSRADIPVIMCN